MGTSGAGGATDPKRIEVGFVVTPELQMIQAGATGQQVEGDVEHVIGFVIRRVELEDRSELIDVSPQVELLDQLHDHSQPATLHGMLLFRQFIIDRSTTNPRIVETAMFINTFLKSSLALSQLFS
jgi:hypothetical protein